MALLDGDGAALRALESLATRLVASKHQIDGVRPAKPLEELVLAAVRSGLIVREGDV
jgi:hypothetical protein